MDVIMKQLLVCSIYGAMLWTFWKCLGESSVEGIIWTVRNNPWLLNFFHVFVDQRSILLEPNSWIYLGLIFKEDLIKELTLKEWIENIHTVAVDTKIGGIIYHLN